MQSSEMAIWNLSLLFATVALAHTGIKTILIDGNMSVSHTFLILSLV
jgi:hypothetical protein